MSDVSVFLTEEAARRGADAEVWESTQEIHELVCREGAVERQSEVTAAATALTVWKDGTEGYAVRMPGRADPALVDTALAVGRALPAGQSPPAAAPADHAPEEVLAPPGFSTSAAGRLSALSAGAPGVDVELRARADRTHVLLHRAGSTPLARTTGTVQLQTRVTAKDERVGFMAHQVFGRTVESVMEAADREVASLTGLARILASEPVADCSYADVLVDGRVMVKLFALVAPAFQWDSVLEGRSPLADRVGERVAVAGVELVDDPLSPDCPGPAPWDDEGTACRRTVLVDDGVLRGFLGSRRTAAASGVPSTGSGRRGPSGEMATIQPGFLALRPGPLLGDGPREGRPLLKVVQANGAHTSNGITGDFSIGANAVLVGSDGTGRNAGNITLAGNVFELLHRIDGHDGHMRVNRGHHSFVASPGVWTSGLTVGR
ncbi:metallopeptidase TldD-related protein [Streptomyces sp. NPDC102402]|uniref:metallopeptidase TldD-related protein n=1 Tax=Streptomyces sp. NPDC102402 TaxID=3366169 RepID=UPI003803986B